MEEEKKWSASLNKKAMVLGLLATLVWVVVLYISFALAEAERVRALGTAQLNWLEQSMDRYNRVADGIASWVVRKNGKTAGFARKAGQYFGFSHSVQSVQLLPLDGAQEVYPWAGWKVDVTKELPAWTADYTTYKRLSPTLAQENEKTGGDDLLLVRPVYLPRAGEKTSDLWGFVVLTVSSQSLHDEMNLARFEDIGVNHELSWQSYGGDNHILYSRGDLSDEAVSVTRNIGGAPWTLRLLPANGWCSWWVIALGFWSGLIPTMAVSFYRGRSLKAEQEGNFDFLTGAYNRNGGEKAAEAYLRKHQRGKVRVMALDIDNFKLVNDMYGHEAGDEVLKRLVQDTKLAFPTGIVIRNGGDEFMILQSYEEENLMNEQIRLFAKTPHRLKTAEGEIKFTTSLGCASYPEHDDRYLKLADKADFALYNVKLNGKSDWRPFDESLLYIQKRVQLGFNLSDLSDHMPGAMFITHCDDLARILFASNPAAELLGCDSWEDFQEYAKGSFVNVVHPDDWPRIYMGARKMAAEGEERKQTRFFPCRLIRKDGKIVDALAAGQYHVNTLHGGVFYVTVYDKSRLAMRFE